MTFYRLQSTLSTGKTKFKAFLGNAEIRSKIVVTCHTLELFSRSGNSIPRGNLGDSAAKVVVTASFPNKIVERKIPGILGIASNVQTTILVGLWLYDVFAFKFKGELKESFVGFCYLFIDDHLVQDFLVSSYNSEWWHGIVRRNYVSLSINEAQSMAGQKKGFEFYIKSGASIIKL